VLPEQKIVASDRSANDRFGWSVAISGDYAMVGAPYEDDDASGGATLTDAGSAYIFVRSGSTWTQQQKIVAGDRAVQDNFGYSVGISGDYAIVGAWSEDEDASGGATLANAGSAYIFVRSGSTWSQQQKIVASDRAAVDYLGFSVAISGDYAMVGAWLEDEDASGGATLSGAGSAYIFARSGNTWSQQQKIVANDRAASDQFGYSVAISGNYAIVGANLEDENASGGATLTDAGSAYIFVRSGNIWAQQQKIVASDRAVADQFGFSVAISGDYAMVGAYLEDENASGSATLSDAGSAYIFVRSGGSWSQQQKIVPSDRAVADQFGWSVAISGVYAIVGARLEDEDASGANTITNSGSVYFYDQNFTLTASAGANGMVTPSGATTVVGGGSQAYTITPAAGYCVQDVLINGSSVGAVTSYTFNNVQANQTISATFVAAPIWYLDADNDNYYTGSPVTQCSSPGAGYKSTGLLGGNDCDDTDNTKWQLLSGYVDADNDGYTAGALLNNICSGASLPSGYKATTLGSDCDDSDANKNVTYSFYADTDNDGFGAGGLVSGVCATNSTTPPSGYSTNNTDCAAADATKWQSATLYIDADNDGYDNGTATVCYGASIPSGYKATTSGTDCDDTDANKNVTYSFYLDADNDGFGAGSLVSGVCATNSTTPPSGYSTNNTDCAAADATKWQSATLYIDADNDGYDNGTATVCYGTSIPSGYKATTSGTDCDDTDANKNLTYSFYVDADNDGFGAGSLVSGVCATNGTTPPSGYSTNNTDCAPTDNTKWQLLGGYVDADNDGYTVGTLLNNICSGATLPSGYKANTLGSDCDDTDANKNVTYSFYVDADNDGFGAGSLVSGVCATNSTTPPSGYSTNNMDCNNNNASVYPGANEVCSNGIDDNCNANIDESCGSNHWTGNTSNDWNTPGNWSNNSVPTATDDAVIPNVSPNFFPLISGPVGINNITVNSGASLQVASAAALTVAGVLTNNGTVTVQDDGALVQGSSSTLAGSGAYSVKRILPTSNLFHYIGSPVNNVGVSAFGIVPSVFNGGNGSQMIPQSTCDPAALEVGSPWCNLLELREDATVLSNCSQSLWHVKSAGTLENARGYAAMAYGTGSTPNLSFNGTVNNGTVTYGGLGNSGPIPPAPPALLDPFNGGTLIYRGWHMVSNPYPSPITFGTGNAALTGMGFDAQVQVWNSALNTWVPSVSNAILPVAQGFQIRNSGASPLSFTTTNAMRTPTSATFFDTPWEQYLTTTLENATSNMQTVIFFHEDATDGYDGKLEANRLFGGTQVPVIYTLAANGMEHMAFNGYAPLYNETKTVVMGVYDGNSPGSYSLRFQDLNTLINTTVVLEDTKLNTFTPVNEGYVYNFTTAAGDETNRFRVHFNMLDDTQIGTQTQTLFSVFPNPAEDMINIAFADAEQGYTLQLRDLSGKTLLAGEVPAGTQNMKVSLSEFASGVYLLEVRSASGERNVIKLIRK
jgi:hypothetical protein